MLVSQRLITVLMAGLVLGAGCSDSSLSILGSVIKQDQPEVVSGWHDPLQNVSERALKLTFGLYVTPDPAQNPIDPPERFTGYHTALDFEVLPNESGQDVTVYAMCEGPIILSRVVDGYGGTLVQACEYDGEPVTVLYGHLDPTSLIATGDTPIAAGESLGWLGDGGTSETSFNRQHLHLGIHKGTEIVLTGYVQSAAELNNFIDPKIVLGYD